MTSLTAQRTANLIAETNDLSLVIDGDGIIRDVALGSDDDELKFALNWLGKPWLDTVTSESRPKIKDLLSSTDNGKRRWRQVNHTRDSEADLPVLYKAMPLGDNGDLIAVGRDLRPTARLQQRLLDAQHSLERDYARLHQAETRYRMLFNLAAEAILIVDADSRRVVEANPAAAELLGRPVQQLINRGFPRGFTDSSTDAIEELLLTVRAAGRGEEISVRSSSSSQRFHLSAALMRRDESPYFLIRMRREGEDSDHAINHKLIDVVLRSPDAFVLTNDHGEVLAANRAFLDLCQAATEMQVAGEPLDQWVGRPGVDIALLLRNLRERGSVGQFGTTVKPEFGAPIAVELSAVAALDSDEPCFGFVIRRQTHSQAAEGLTEATLPRTLEEMTEMVGQVPLKDLVRQATGIIERMCIESALKLTGDSRASAAEMLGLSRQSLYVKLRRYGLGDNDSGNSSDDDKS